MFGFHVIYEKSGLSYAKSPLVKFTVKLKKGQTNFVCFVVQYYGEEHDKMELVMCIPNKDYQTLKHIAKAYLPGSEEGLAKALEKYPSAVAGYYINGKLIGCCFGFASGATSFTLEGIAIIEPYHAQGRGGRLLDFFEKRVRELGFESIGLGSAGGYVEKFYIKNGYRPTCLKILVEDDLWRRKQDGYPFPVIAEETQGAYTKLVIGAENYSEMDKDAIEDYYLGVESFFVFEKIFE